MIDPLLSVFAAVAVLGSALTGGVFFAFSSFVMKALARMPFAAGVAAMQAINIAVINPSFLGAFMGTALLSIAVIVLALVGGGHPAAMLFLGAAVLYLAGTLLVTLFGNVPLNNSLATVCAADPATCELWEHYLERWTRWNHVRTLAALLSALVYAVGFRQYAGS